MIYFADATQFDPNDAKWNSVLSKARKQRMLSLKQADDKQRALAVELLLCFVSGRTFNLWANCFKKVGIMKTQRNGGTFNLWANCPKKAKEGLMRT